MASRDIAIVGLGPVGATLANLLGRLGLRVDVFERDRSPYALPRAVHFDDEVMRVFQAVGLAEEIAAGTHVSPGTLFVDREGRVMLDWSRRMEEGPQGWHESYRFHQPTLEGVLRAGLERFPKVRVRLGHEVGDPEALDARYVVGCDGARSGVRASIGGGSEDLGFHERWLVIDLVLKRPRPDLGDYTRQFCDPVRPATYVRTTGNRRRWEIRVEEDERDDPGTVWRLLAPWIGPEDAEIERAVIYTFHATVARRWRRGRLFIAGDAAHQTPPFMGQGMCAGIRDAANLAWKLAAVLRGGAPESLLDSYASERMPHVRDYVELAVRMGRLLNATETEDMVSAAAARGEGTDRMESIRPRLGPGLHRGESALAGRPGPQPRLADGRRLDDAAGLGPVLLLREPAAVESCGVPAVAAGADWLGAHGLAAALLRPDRYVFGVAETLDEAAPLCETYAAETGGADA